MQVQSCARLLRDLGDACVDDAPRREALAHGHERARQLLPHLPWIHRTGRPGNSWRQIFAERRLRPSKGTAHELADDREESVYFFLGACAFPKGNLVLVLRADDAPLRERATFSPFDTGSLAGFVALTADHPHCRAYEPWTSADNRCRCLRDHTGSARDLDEFVPSYLAAHFFDAQTYVRGSQESEPDFAPYHGLRSISGDRRVWTVEVQVHGAQGVAIDDERLLEVVVRGKDRFDALPGAIKDRAYLLAEDEDEDERGDSLAERCGQRICARFAEAQS